MSRSQVKRLIEGGRVTLNGVVVKARASLSVGDSIAWECEALIEEALSLRRLRWMFCLRMRLFWY